MSNESKGESAQQSEASQTRVYSLPGPAEAAGLILRRWWIILIIAAVGGAGSYFVSTKFRPVYGSYALLRLKPPSTAKVGEQEDDESSPEPAMIMRRLTVSLGDKEVLEPILSLHAKEFDPADLKKPDALRGFIEKHISIEHRSGNVFKLLARGRTPSQAQKITTYLAAQALKLHRGTYEKKAIRIEAFSRQQVMEASAKLKKLEDEMVDFLEKNPSMKIKSLHSDKLELQGTDRLRTSSKTSSVLTRSLNKLAKKNPKLKELLARKRRLKADLRGLTETSTSSTATLSNTLNEAKNNLAQLRGEGKKDSHPVVKQVLRRIKSLQAKIAAAAPGRQTATSKYAAKVRDELRQVEKSIRDEVGKVSKKLVPKKKVDRTELEAMWGKFRRQHRLLSDQHKKLQDVAVNASLKKNLRIYEASKTASIMEAPTRPERPIGLNRMIILAAGSVASFLFGIVCALGLGLLDIRLRKPEQVTRANKDFELLAVLEHHATKHLKQAQRVRQKELIQGEATGGSGGESDDGSVIKWLRETDDLDTALSLLKPGEGGDGGGGGGDKNEPWLDAVATAFYDRNAPRGLGDKAAGGEDSKETPGGALVKAGANLPAIQSAGGVSVPQLKVNTLPSAPPLASGLFVSTAPRSASAEQMRLLAARLESQIGNALRVVAVTSWEPNIGKTTVAANLAMVLAESQKRVLAIDACPGGAALTQIFGIEPEGEGLCEQLQKWLDGGAEPWEVVQIADTLTIMPATSSHQPALPLLSSEAFSRLVSDMLQIYDALVVDTEALKASSDAVVLQRKVDGYVIVAGRNKSTTKSLREITSRLDISRILGVVFNKH